MGRRYTSSQAGLSTVELLITLFVAGLFLTAGYTLYSFVLKDSGATRADARATAVANEYLELYRPVSDSCSPDTPTIDPQPTVEGLTNVNVTVVISCPDSDNPSISKIEVTVDADNLQNPVKVGGYEGPEAPGPDEYNIGSSFPNYSAPTTPVFYWTAISGADSYGIRYKVNGGSWVSAADVVGGNNTTYTYGGAEVFRDDTVTLEVTAKQGGNPMTASGYGTATIPKWTKCALQNGWLDYSANWGSGEFTKTNSGVVMMKGLVKSGSSYPSVLCNLPAGFRPSDRLMFHTGSNGATGRVDVETNGDVQLVIGTNAWADISVLFVASGASGYSEGTPTSSTGWVDYDGVGGYSDVKARKDSSGRAFLQGLAKSGTTSIGTCPTYTAAYKLPAGYVSAVETYILPAQSGGSLGSFLLFAESNPDFCSGSGTNARSLTPNSIPSNGYWSLQALYYTGDYTGSWTAPSLQAGWVDYNNTSYPPGYTKGSDGIVSLKGLIKNGTTTNGTTLFTLPTGYRPKDLIMCDVVSLNLYARLDIRPDGTVTIGGGSVSSTWISLSGCDFMGDL